jgi:hypothetical protein
MRMALARWHDALLLAASVAASDGLSRRFCPEACVQDGDPWARAPWRLELSLRAMVDAAAWAWWLPFVASHWALPPCSWALRGLAAANVALPFVESTVLGWLNSREGGRLRSPQHRELVCALNAAVLAGLFISGLVLGAGAVDEARAPTRWGGLAARG